MTAVLAYNNRLRRTSTQGVTIEDSGSDFASSPPISNMATVVLPEYAEFTGATATFTAQADDGASSPTPESFSASVFALLGLEGFEDGADFDFMDDADGSSYGTAEWVPTANQRHVILVLDSPVTLDTLRVGITNAGTGTHRIGAVWASPSVQGEQRSAISVSLFGTGINVTSPGGSTSPYSDGKGLTTPGYLRAFSQTDGLALFDALFDAGQHDPVLWMPRSDSGFVERFSTYGYVQSDPTWQHVEGQLYDAVFRIVESL